MFKQCHIKTQCAAIFLGNINKKQYHHRQINKHIKQDWGDRNSWKSAAQGGSLLAWKLWQSVFTSSLFFSTKQPHRNQMAWVLLSTFMSKWFVKYYVCLLEEENKLDVKCLKEKMQIILLEIYCELKLCYVWPRSLSLPAFVFSYCRQ